MWRLPVNLLLGALAAGGIILVFLLRLVMGERPRGEVGLIFAGIGASLTLPNAQRVSKPVVGAATFCAVVIMAIITNLVTPPLLKWSLGRAPSARSHPTVESG
jgi:Na+:H+ antiporter